MFRFPMPASPRLRPAAACVAALCANAMLAAGPAPSAGAQAFNGGPDAHRLGAWSPVADWPVLAIHAALTADGRVMTYGSKSIASADGFLVYDIWDPKRATTGGHNELPSRTSTDYFCCAQIAIPGTDRMLLAGGSVEIDGVRNLADSDVNFYDASTRTVTPGPSMRRGRWYPTLRTLPSGEILIHGGRGKETPDDTTNGNTLPEVYDRDAGWRPLWGAASDAIYRTQWSYPGSWITPRGTVWAYTSGRRMFELDPYGNNDQGTIRSLGTDTGPSRARNSAAQFRHGRVLITGGHERGQATDTTRLVDLRQNPPAVTAGPPMRFKRSDHDATILPNGNVFIVGGSAVSNTLQDVAYAAEWYRPGRNDFQLLAAGDRPRLYHSVSLLLPDASVLVAGGGRPGPVENYNAERYYPPYLFKRDGSGELADRPVIRSVSTLRYGRWFTIRTDGSDITAVRLVKAGSVTHGLNMDQHYLGLRFEQDGDVVRARMTGNPANATPGRYLVFVIGKGGVPSVAAVRELYFTRVRFQNATSRLAPAPAGEWEWAEVRAEPARAGDADQRWTPIPLGGGRFRIRHAATGYYLTATDENPASTLRVAKLDPSWWTQQWYREPIGGGNFRYRNRWSGRYLAAPPASGGRFTDVERPTPDAATTFREPLQ